MGTVCVDSAFDGWASLSDTFEALFVPGGSVMADDVLTRAAKSKRKSRAFMLEVENGDARANQFCNSYGDVK